MGRKHSRRSHSPDSDAGGKEHSSGRRRERKDRKRSRSRSRGDRPKHGKRDKRRDRSDSRGASREKQRKDKSVRKKRDRSRDRGRKREGKSSAAKHGAEQRAKEPVPAAMEIPTLSEEDYFKRATEFRVWLLKDRKIRFGDLTSKDSHQLFKKFVKRWNKRELDKSYYVGIPDEVVAEASTVPHKWSFVKGMPDRERDRLDSMQGAISRATNAGEAAAAAPQRAAGPPLTEAQQRRRRREHERAMLDEIAPKATGREAIAERRKERGARMHGAARDRDQAMDGLDVPEEDAMGSASSDLAALKARHAARYRRRDEHVAAKAAEARTREQAKLDELRAVVGLQGGGAIRIRPRE